MPDCFQRLAVLTILCLAANTICAGSATWSQNPVNNDWNTPLNWMPSTVPNGPADVATFANSNAGSVAISSQTAVSDILFSVGASSFTIAANPTVNPASTLTLSGDGIRNNSGITQNFVVAVNNETNGSESLINFTNSASAGLITSFVVNGGTRGGEIYFYQNATADHAAFILNGGTTSNGGGGSMDFLNDSTAANATFICNPGSVSGAIGGFIYFDDNSTAADASFTNFGATVTGGGKGYVQFFGGNGGNAIFVNNGGTAPFSAGGTTQFSTLASAANATLIANPGSNGGGGGGVIVWGDGGTCKVKIYGNGYLDTANQSAGPVTVGSLEGSGQVNLGNFNLGIGSNNLSTAFSGVFHDGTGNQHGSVTKVGGGTLTLSGANLHSGGTTINGGGLMVNNTSGSGTGSGPVTVNNVATRLGGSGTISGGVTINNGAVLSGGSATTASNTLNLGGNAILNPGAVVEIGLGPNHTHSSLRRTGGAWSFANAQAFSIVNVAAAPGLYDNIITGLAGDPGGTASWIITMPKFAGTFSYDGTGNIDLNITAVPSVPAEISRSGNDIVITFQVMQGRTYHLERKTALTDLSWQSISGVTDLTASSDGLAQITDSNAIALGKAFYQVNLLP